MIQEFKKFILRGNVLDLAIGIIIGGAFGKIVSSLVNDILMPVIGIILGGVDFSTLSFTIKDAVINYGLFIQTTVDFLIIAASIFVLIKIINRFIPKKEEKVVNTELKVLEEIRDLLKKKK